MSAEPCCSAAEPATKYHPKNQAVLAECCLYRRCARNLLVRDIGGERRYTCAPGKGCKDTRCP